VAGVGPLGLALVLGRLAEGVRAFFFSAAVRKSTFLRFSHWPGGQICPALIFHSHVNGR